MNFRKMISNLPFNPGRVGEVSFYAKRIKQESSIRRTGFVFIALAMIVQMVAVIAPPQASLASSDRNMIQGTFAPTVEGVLAKYDASPFVQAAYTHFGITRDDITKMTPTAIDKATDIKNGTRHLVTAGRGANSSAGETSVSIARQTGIHLIVNDYWREAIAAGADFVHLGQEDLATADVAEIKRAGLRLGISTHNEAELRTALAANPDYIALGPVYETKLKAMPWAPQGLARVTAWKAAIGSRPLVAIGGITPERAPGVVAAGADSVAVITDFLTHGDPEDRVRDWVAWSHSGTVKK